VRASKVIKALSDLWKLHMLHAATHQ